MSVHTQENTTENLLKAVVSLPKNEFERFFSDARKLKRREERLTAKLPKFDLSETERRIYQQLSRKFRAENINDEERKQLTNLTDKLEGLNVERLKCLVEIAEIRKKDLREVMRELDIKPQSYE
ncbi:MAG: hypothetical protein M3T96_02945 [Acidobacteriota bacterium]|nr:hypothetical protein [Acidobacteriota bacterium]